MHPGEGRGLAADDAAARFRRAQERALAAYGLAFESRTVETPSGSAHVLVAGAGPPLLMVHGLGAPSALWAPLLSELTGFTVHAVDLPGHGLTPAGDHRLCREALRATATRFLSGVMESLALPRGVPIVANSLGSLWATWLALDEPERVGALVHVGCPALILGASAPLAMRLGSAGGVGPLLLNLRRPTRRQMFALAGLLGDSLHDHPRLADVLVAQDRMPGYKPTLRQLSRALIRVRGARPELALTAPELERVDHPVQLIWGDRDPFGDLNHAYACFAAFRHAALQVVGGGHAPWLSAAPEIGEAARRWLDRHASGRRAAGF